MDTPGIVEMRAV